MSQNHHHPESHGDQWRGSRRTWGARHLVGFSALLMMAACAKTPSILWAHVSVDEGVPPLSDLRATVVSLSHPGLEPSSQRESLVMGDAGDRPAPFAFPVVIPITLNAEYVGDVLLTVEGLDRATEAVLASGTVATTVIAAKEMHVVVTMSLVEGADGLGGAGGSAP